LGKLLVRRRTIVALEWARSWLPGWERGAGRAWSSDSGAERIAIASYPFRDFIAGAKTRAAGKMELKEFAAHVSAKFNIKKIEPWSAHFLTLDKAYLEELLAAVEKAGGAIVNIAVDASAALMRRQRGAERAVAFSKQWIDAAVTIGSRACGRIYRKRRIRSRTWSERGELEACGGIWRGENVVVNMETTTRRVKIRSSW